MRLVSGGRTELSPVLGNILGCRVVRSDYRGRRDVFGSFEDSFKSEVTIAYLRALQEEFGRYIHPVVDNATYFASNKIYEIIADSKMTVSHLTTGSPDINPFEEC